MTDLSLAAAEDEVARLEIGVKNAEAKATRLEKQAADARRDKKRLEHQLTAAKKAVTAAKKLEPREPGTANVEAHAGVAEAKGTV